MGRLYDSQGNDIGEDTEPAIPVGLDAPLPPTIQAGAQARENMALLDSTAPQLEPPVHPGVEGSSMSGMDSSEGENMGAMLMGNMFDGGAPIRPAASVMDEGENYLPFGGKDAWNETFVTKPQQLESAIMQGAQAEEDLGKSRADFFDRQQKTQAEELAIIKQRQMERQQEVLQRQAQLDDATKRYSNDLSDKGQYWRNPGNIISAIGVALMSTTNAAIASDPSMGIRLINQAVNADFMQRKEQADMHLGQLRSNVAAYRELAGDKNLGDRLAYAESQRVAAMELERIAGQFQGPIAKAKAAAISKELLRSYQLQMGQLHAAMVYNKAHMENPAIKASIVKTGKATGGEGYTPFTGGQPSTASGTSSSGGSSGGGTATSSMSMPGAAQFLAGKPLSEEQKRLVDARSPGASASLSAVSQEMRKRAWDLAGGNPQKAVHELREIQKQVLSEKQEIAKSLSSGGVPAKVNGYRRMKQELGVINNLAVRMGIKHDDLLGTGAESITGPGFQSKYSDFWNAQLRADPNKADSITRQKQESDDAVQRFKQLVAMQSTEYIHDHFGSAFTPREEEQFQQSVRSGWRGINNFMDANSRTANSQLAAALQIGSPAARILYRAEHGLGTDPLDVKSIAKADPEPRKKDETNYGGVKPKTLTPTQQKALKTLSGGKD